MERRKFIARITMGALAMGMGCLPKNNRNRIKRFAKKCFMDVGLI